MDFISSKNIFLLTRDTLKLIDKHLMKHGSRTSYIFYKMLEQKGGYELFELAEFAMLATLHDIGAYKTDHLHDFLYFDVKDNLRHSIYGYLFLKYLSPMGESSKIILYHGRDCAELSGLTKEERFLANGLRLAEMIEIYQDTLGKKFELDAFVPYIDKKFDREIYDLFLEADSNFHILSKIESEEYEQELDTLMDYIMFTNDQKRQAMEMIMYCLTFRNKYMVIDSVTATCLCNEFAYYMGLGNYDTKVLYYAALLHDVGMLGINPKIIDETEDFFDKKNIELKIHIEIIQNLLKKRVKSDIIENVESHHERMDGSGYPKGLKAHTISTSMAILQFADVLTSYINGNMKRLPMEQEQIFEFLKGERTKNRFESRLIKIMLDNYDEITTKVRMETNEFLSMHNMLNRKFQQAYKEYK